MLYHKRTTALLISIVLSLWSLLAAPVVALAEEGEDSLEAQEVVVEDASLLSLSQDDGVVLLSEDDDAFVLLSNAGRNCGNTYVASNGDSISDVSWTKDVFVPRNVTLTISGTTNIEGNIYVLGTLEYSGTLTVNGTLYCLHYSIFSAGDYDYGYVNSKGGRLNVTTLYVKGDWIDITIPSVPSVSHSFGDWITVKEPWVGIEGIKERTCNNCGEVQRETIPALGRISLTGATVSIEPQVYTGWELTPDVKVTLGGVTLVPGDDFSVSYAGNIELGSADVTITGEGDYKDTIKASFRIVPSLFVDVTERTAHLADINWLADQGISTGWSMADGTKQFRPYANVARADMAAFLFRLAKGWGLVDESWQPSGSASFLDVTEKTSHYREVMWLAESGISKGWDVPSGGKEFRPYANVARADMAAFLHRLQLLREESVSLRASESGTSPFLDVTEGTPHYDDILWLAESEISKGWDVEGGKEFRPYNNVARADMAAFLHRLDDLWLVR